MQKKLSLLLLQPMLLLALASCSGGEGDIDVVKPVEPRVTDGILPFSASVGIEKGSPFATRSTLDATWDGDELLAVSMYSTVDGEPQAPAFCTPRCYGVSPDNSVHHIGNTILNAADTVPFSWPDESESVILRGWHYPKEYRTEVNHTFFSMPTVQDTKAKMQECDFLFAPADTITAYTQTANLVFWHQFSIVDVYIESGKENFVTAATDITMLSTDWVQTSQYSEPTANGQHYGTWSSFTDANNANLTTAVTPLRVDDTAGQIHVRALVMPQPTEGKLLVSLRYGGKVYGYELPDGHRPWMPGMKYAYYLRLADKLTLIAVIKDFIEDGEYEGQLKRDNINEPYGGLTLEAMEPGAEVEFDIPYELRSNSVYYSLDNGRTWTEYPHASVITLENVGDRVSFKGNNDSYCKNGDPFYYSNISCTKDCYVYGNIMSLTDGDDYASATELRGEEIPYDDSMSGGPSYYCVNNFAGLFKDNTHIKNHPTRQLVLPATKLTSGCYQGMFFGCLGLTKAPVLPATKLAPCCYLAMFGYCAGLVTAPDLPATTLEYACYQEMFADCTGLVTAPELPAKTLVPSCYRRMFGGCVRLSSVTCLATNIDTLPDFALDYWMDGWGNLGTFYKSPG